MTLTMPPLWVLCHPRLGLGMFNLRTKFKVVITAHYIEKAKQKCRKLDGLG